jgi:hypothetical protein
VVSYSAPAGQSVAAGVDCRGCFLRGRRLGRGVPGRRLRRPGLRGLSGNGSGSSRSGGIRDRACRGVTRGCLKECRAVSRVGCGRPAVCRCPSCGFAGGLVEARGRGARLRRGRGPSVPSSGSRAWSRARGRCGRGRRLRRAGRAGRLLRLRGSSRCCGESGCPRLRWSSGSGWCGRVRRLRLRYPSGVVRSCSAPAPSSPAPSYWSRSCGGGLNSCTR